MRPLLALLFGIAAAACGSAFSADMTTDGGEDAGTGDGTTEAEAGGGDARGDAGPVDGAPTDAIGGDAASDGSCVASIPAPWAVSLLEKGSSHCPDGQTPTSGIANLDAGPGACTCDCVQDQPPSCTTGTLVPAYGEGNGCSIAGASITFNGSTCVALAATTVLTPQVAATPLSPTGAHCTATGHQDPSAVTVEDVGTCAVALSDRESVCNGSAPAGFTACIAAMGDQVCPGAPFTNKTVVYDPGPQLSCSGCSCVTGGSCTSAVVTFYGMGMPCTSFVSSANADGTCVNTGVTDTIVSYASYAAAVANASMCTPSASVPTIFGSNARTYCCR